MVERNLLIQNSTLRWRAPDQGAGRGPPPPRTILIPNSLILRSTSSYRLKCRTSLWMDFSCPRRTRLMSPQFPGWDKHRQESSGPRPSSLEPVQNRSGPNSPVLTCVFTHKHTPDSPRSNSADPGNGISRCTAIPQNCLYPHGGISARPLLKAVPPFHKPCRLCHGRNAPRSFWLYAGGPFATR